MPVTARDNRPNSDRTFNGPYPWSKQTIDLSNGSSTLVTGTTVQTVHVCKRSANVKGRIEPFKRKIIRYPTPFSRMVTDTPRIDQVRRTIYLSNGKPYKEEIETEPMRIPWSGIASSSTEGRIATLRVMGDPDAVNNAIVQTLNKLGDQKVDIGTALAEARQTFSMLGRTSLTLLRSYRFARQRRWKDFLSELGLSNRQFPSQDAANAYLAFKYGWSPLMLDLMKGYAYFKDKRNHPMFLEAKGSSVRTFHHKSINNTQYRWEGNSKHRGYCAIKATIDLERLRQLNMIGLQNPAKILWELVPYSFVIDWFIPIGNVLQALSDTSGLSFVSGYFGDSNEAALTVSCIQNDRAETYIRTLHGVAPVRYFSHQRTVLGSFPHGRLYTKQKWFTDSNVQSALALLRQSMR